MEESNQNDIDIVSTALLKIRDKKEAGKFLTDVLSKRELETLILRIKIAQMLYKGISYIEIERKTGASSATISKMSEAIKYGNDGLRTILERTKK